MRSSRRATWGMAKPMNDTGPQKAVVMAVSKPVTMSSQLRTKRMLTPRFWAYWSPSSSAFSGLMSSNEQMRPTKAKPANIGRWCMDTPPNEPMPHTIYDFTPSSVAKNWSSVMADDDR